MTRLLESDVRRLQLKNGAEFSSAFRNQGKLGEGAFSKVYHVLTDAEKHYAVKICYKPDSNHENASAEFKLLEREWNALRSLQGHSHVINLYKGFETPTKIYLVTELATGGDLLEWLSKTEATYSEELICQLSRTLLNAIAHMHNQGFVHRDLKPTNILMSNQSDNARLKIADFGLSRSFNCSTEMKTVCGTHAYLAPEIVLIDRRKTGGYDQSVDIWAIGLVLFRMLYGFQPFARSSETAVFDAILDGIVFPDGYNVSALAMSLVTSLLQQNPQDRTTPQQAQSHNWFLEATSGPLSNGNVLVQEILLCQSRLPRRMTEAHEAAKSAACNQERQPAAMSAAHQMQPKVDVVPQTKSDKSSAWHFSSKKLTVPSLERLSPRSSKFCLIA